MARIILWMVLNLICLTSPAISEEMRGTFPGKVSEWNGFRCHDFSWNERGAIVVVPKEVASGKPWIWRASFLGHRHGLDVVDRVVQFLLRYSQPSVR